MIVSATEFKSNIGKFLKLSQEEDVLIMRNGKLISKLTKIGDEETNQKLQALDDIAGFLQDANTIDIDKLKQERILDK